MIWNTQLTYSVPATVIDFHNGSSLCILITQFHNYFTVQLDITNISISVNHMPFNFLYHLIFLIDRYYPKKYFSIFLGHLIFIIDIYYPKKYIEQTI